MEDQEKIKELFSIISALEVEIQAIQAFSAELAAERILRPAKSCDGAATKGALVYHLTPSQRGVIRRAIEKIKDGNSHS